MFTKSPDFVCWCECACARERVCVCRGGGEAAAAVSSLRIVWVSDHELLLHLELFEHAGISWGGWGVIRPEMAASM